MTKRDFVLLAEIVKDIADGGALCMDDARDRVAFAEYFAIGLAKSNPRFDRTRFVEAATYSEDRAEAAEAEAMEECERAHKTAQTDCPYCVK